MNKKKYFISIREILITLAIALAAIIVGSINRTDLEVTKIVYNHDNPSIFGIFFSVIAEWPGYLGAILVGTLLLVMNKQLTKLWQKICSIIAGIGFILFGTYGSFNHAFDLKDFNNMASLDNLKVIVILFVVVALLADAATIFGTLLLSKNKSVREMFTVVMFVGGVIVIQILIITAAKFVISRPRPYYLFENNIIESGFKNWWEASLFSSIKGGDDFKSCPSGHTASAATLMAVLPALTLLTEHKKDDKKLQVILYYVGLIWTLIMAMSRIYAGAHFLSDVGMALLIATIVIWICDIFLSNRQRTLEQA